MFIDGTERADLHFKQFFRFHSQSYWSCVSQCVVKRTPVTGWKKNVQKKTKGKVAPTTPWRHTGGNRGVAPLILNFGTWWAWVVSVTHRQLCCWVRSARQPRNRRLGGPLGRFWRKKFMAPEGKQTTVSLFSSPLPCHYADWAIPAWYLVQRIHYFVT